MKADKKNRIHVVYSTDPNYNYEYNNETEDGKTKSESNTRLQTT